MNSVEHRIFHSDMTSCRSCTGDEFYLTPLMIHYHASFCVYPVHDETGFSNLLKQGLANGLGNDIQCSHGSMEEFLEKSQFQVKN